MQSAYFGQKSFSIFTTCCYLKVDSVILNENVTVTSEANDQSRSAAMSRWRKVLSYQCLGKIPSRRIVNPSFYYRDLSWRILSSGITTSAITRKGPWMVFEARERAHGWCSRHGKGPMDGVPGTGKGPWMVFEEWEKAHGWCSRHGKGPMDGVRGTGKGPWMVFEARKRAHGWCSRHGKGPMDGVRGTRKGPWMVFEAT